MKSIIVNLQLEGIHCWPKCPYPEVAYLKDPHRHTFYIECQKEVKKNDREIEIIIFKNKVREFLNLTFGFNEFKLLDFGTYSCEDIAEVLFNHFNLTYCKVLEDGENGACISRERD